MSDSAACTCGATSFAGMECVCDSRFAPKPADPVLVQFDCGHRSHVPRDEYGDGSAWCRACGELQLYVRCLTCGSLDCQSKEGPTLAHR